jgi:hypothetical protein
MIGVFELLEQRKKQMESNSETLETRWGGVPPPPDDPGARPAASDPGPADPVRPRRSASRASWARARLYCSSGLCRLQTHRVQTRSPDQQQDHPGLGSQCHVANSSSGARGPLGPLRCCHMAIPGVRVRPRPAVITVTLGT